MSKKGALSRSNNHSNQIEQHEKDVARQRFESKKRKKVDSLNKRDKRHIKGNFEGTHIYSIPNENKKGRKF
ncbi:MAG: hypothetical protein H6679_05345 [Epsilonproteobacteria bacterium]|nr:hypothetical protein [Campylobacterota bacterium]